MSNGQISRQHAQANRRCLRCPIRVSSQCRIASRCAGLTSSTSVTIPRRKNLSIGVGSVQFSQSASVIDKPPAENWPACSPLARCPSVQRNDARGLVEGTNQCPSAAPPGVFAHSFPDTPGESKSPPPCNATPSCSPCSTALTACHPCHRLIPAVPASHSGRDRS